MKKKLLMFLCVIACTLSLAACGKTEYTPVEQAKIDTCVQISNSLIDIADIYGTEEKLADLTGNYAKHEVAYILESITYSYIGYSVEAELGVFEGLLTTYVQTSEDMGGIVNVGECTSEISGKEIIVTYPVQGNVANGTFKFTYTNDMFTKLTGAECVAKLSFAQNMKKASKSMGNAGLNTLLGMGTVFTILILISLIISSFNLFKPKAKPVEVKKETVETTEVVEELADDTELVAVIMAAINAYESANGGSTDGYTVRSIRRANRRN